MMLVDRDGWQSQCRIQMDSIDHESVLLGKIRYKEMPFRQLTLQTNNVRIIYFSVVLPISMRQLMFFLFFLIIIIIQQTINKTNQVFYISPYNTTWQAFRTW